MFSFTFAFSNVVKFATPNYRDVCGYFPRGFGNEKRFFLKKVQNVPKLCERIGRNKYKCTNMTRIPVFSVEKILHPPVFSVVGREQQRSKTACRDNKMFSAFNNKGVSKKCHFFYLSSSNHLW